MSLGRLAGAKVLLVGAGSGRDMAAGMFVRRWLLGDCSSVDLAGFLTPWALHLFDGEIEQPVNELPARATAKVLAHAPERPLDSFYEPLLPGLGGEIGARIGRYAVFSLHWGFERLAEGVEEWLRDGGYDVVVLLDVGGDILGADTDLNTLLTPIVDWSCLEIFSHTARSPELQVAILGPGVDGELPPERVRSSLQEISSLSGPGERHRISDTPGGQIYFTQLNRRLDSMSGSRSRTAQFIEQLGRSPGRGEVVRQGERRYVLGTESWVAPFQVRVAADLAATTVLLDGQALASLRPGREWVRAHSVLDAWFGFESRRPCGTELDLCSVPLSIDDEPTGSTVYLAVPCQYLSGEQRASLLRSIAQRVSAGMLPSAVMRDEDRTYVEQKETVATPISSTHCLISAGRPLSTTVRRLQQAAARTANSENLMQRGCRA